MSATPAQLTAIHRRALEVAVGNTQIAKDIADKIDGVERAGTLGVTAALGGAVDEQALGNDHLTKITLTSLAIATTDLASTAGAVGSKKIYTMPEGLIRVNGVTVDLAFTCTSGLTTALKASIGTIPAATNDTLSLTKANLVQSTGGTITTGAGTIKATSKATALTALTDNSGGTASDTIAAQTGSYVQATQQNTIASLIAKINALIAARTLNGDGIAAVIDGTATAVDIYLNLSAVDANSSIDATVTVTGTIYINWTWMGDKS